MPFGEYAGKSVEQIALQDYKYFTWVLGNVGIKKPSLRERFDFVEHVGNNFLSQVRCNGEDCNNPGKIISVYQSLHDDNRSSSTGFVYCSLDCLNHDSKITPDTRKVDACRLGFRAALSVTKYDTNALMQVVAECMGLRPGRRTKEYLEDFFNRCQLRTP